MPVCKVYLTKKYLDKPFHVVFSDSRQKIVELLRDRVNLLSRARHILIDNFNFDFTEDIDLLDNLLDRAKDNLTEWNDRSYQYEIYNMQQVLLDLDIDSDSFAELNRSIENSQKIIDSYK